VGKLPARKLRAKRQNRSLRFVFDCGGVIDQQASARQAGKGGFQVRKGNANDIPKHVEAP
jgi:hypothetical protein